MPRRKITPQSNPYRGPDWQKFYPDVLGRVTANYRSTEGRRDRQYTSFYNMLGLNTALDDNHKQDGESPFLRNCRYMGERQEYQAAQVTSRNGSRLISTYGDVDHFVTANNSETTIEMYEGKAIRFQVRHSDTLTRLQLWVNNVEGAHGRMRVLFKTSKDATPVCDTNVPLDGVKGGWKEYIVRPIIPLEAEKDGGIATIQLEIMDDVNPEDVGKPYPVRGRKVLVLGTGASTHEEATFVMPSQEEPWKTGGMTEIPLSFIPRGNAPLVGFTTNACKTLPRGSDPICVNGQKYVVYPIKENGQVKLLRTNLSNGETIVLNASVSPNATAVRFAQGKDKLYYVDGESYLQRIDLNTWVGEQAITTQDMIDAPGTTPESLRAKKGASLIVKINNRFWISGFKDDPNAFQLSGINSVGDGVQYDQYYEAGYSPDRNSKESACGPIRALEQFNGDCIIARSDGISVYHAPMGLEFGSTSSTTPTQVSTFAFNMGIDRQEDMCSFAGSLYYYNKSEGLRRYSGSDATFQSVKVDNELRHIPNSSNRFMFAHGNKVHFFFDRNNTGHPDHNLLYHLALANSSPWYMDNQVPVMWAVSDQNEDAIYAMHSYYPAVYQLYDVNAHEDFDSSIPMIYYTQYKNGGYQMGWTILRRVLVSVIANDTYSWFVSVDKDRENNPAVFRKWVRGISPIDNGPDAQFPDADAYQEQILHVVLRRKCRRFNIGVKVLAWKSNAMLVSAVGEVGTIRVR